MDKHRMIVVLFILIVLIFIYILRPRRETMEEPKENIQELKLEPKLTESYLTLDNYIGQTKSIIYLKGHIKKAQEYDDPLPHTILWGYGGLGKSTLGKAVASHMNSRFIEIVPANLKSTKELFSIFFAKICTCGYTNPYSANRCLGCRNEINIYFEPQIKLQKNDMIFLEECHRLRTDIEEAMYSLMQDGYMMIRYNGVDQIVEFPPITLMGATTRLGDLNQPFRDRFKINIHLEPYNKKELSKIINMYVEHQHLTIDQKALIYLSKISHGVPRIAKKFVDDCATLSPFITLDSIDKISDLLNIDKNGLDETHRKILKYILMRMQAVKNGGAGANAIASSVGISVQVYIEVYEFPLMYQELIFQGSKGRRLTDKALDMYFNQQEKEKIR